ncbi:MAG: NAD-dependent epimerase/dehydratase family protein [Alphaproteobacteria bacterium]|nr:NAD-dependent epimerase/dehydratase family protein [Alphaproteobacteria bacterium]
MADEAPVLYPLAGRRVWVAGHRGMVGSAIVRRLKAEDCEILTVGRDEVDLRRQDAVERWMARTRPDTVFLAAATVGGIHANDTRPAEFLYDNLVIESNIVNTAKEVGVSKLMFLGSACIYPREAPQPMAEDALLSGPLEPTNEWYAVAKIAGIKLCQAYRRQWGCDFISAMPNNLYGPGDNFDLESSHVLPALMRKIHEAKEAGRDTVPIWGTGRPLREFLHVDDLADALVFLTMRYSDAPHVNIGSGEEIGIGDLAALIADAVGWRGRFEFDSTRPDGMMRKLLDVGRLHAMGWRAKTGLRDGVASTYRWFLEHRAEVRAG